MTTDTPLTHFAEQPVCVEIHSGRVWVSLADGRVIGAPLAWYPFLLLATPAQREKVELQPFGVWWVDLHDGISIEALLAGRKTPLSLEDYQQRITAAHPTPTAATSG